LFLSPNSDLTYLSQWARARQEQIKAVEATGERDGAMSPCAKSCGAAGGRGVGSMAAAPRTANR
jgi:hypothetical protein